jgi:hypothetical protein
MASFRGVEPVRVCSKRDSGKNTKPKSVVRDVVAIEIAQHFCTAKNARNFTTNLTKSATAAFDRLDIATDVVFARWLPVALRVKDAARITNGRKGKPRRP